MMLDMSRSPCNWEPKPNSQPNQGLKVIPWEEVKAEAVGCKGGENGWKWGPCIGEVHRPLEFQEP